MLTREMIDSGVEWIGKVPVDWQYRRIGNYFYQVKDKNIDMQESNLLSLSYGSIIRRDINTSDGLLPASFNTYNIVRTGDIVLRMTDLQNDQKSLRTGYVNEQGIITSAYITIRPIDMSLVNPKYIQLLLHSFDVNKGFYGMGSGVRQNVTFNDIKKLPIMIPLKETQDKIIDKLETTIINVNNIITRTKKSIAELKKYKQSIITETVTKGLNLNAEMKDCKIEWIGDVPKNWTIKALKYVVSERKQQISCNTDAGYRFRYVDIGSVSFENGIEKFELMKYKDAPSRAKKIVYKNDIIISTVRTYLKSISRIIDDKDLIVSTGFCVLIPRENVMPAFLEYMLKAEYFTSQVTKLSSGIAYPSITSERLLSTKVLIPPLEEQKEIASYLDVQINKIDTLIQDKVKILQELEKYKESLIYEYVIGKKEV